MKIVLKLSLKKVFTLNAHPNLFLKQKQQTIDTCKANFRARHATSKSLVMWDWMCFVEMYFLHTTMFDKDRKNNNMARYIEPQTTPCQVSRDTVTWTSQPLVVPGVGSPPCGSAKVFLVVREFVNVLFRACSGRADVRRLLLPGNRNQSLADTDTSGDQL